MKHRSTQLQTILLFLSFALLAGCSTFKVTYDQEFYNREACKAEEEGWTRNRLRSSYPEAIPLSHTIVGVNPTYGVVGEEIWRIDANFLAQVRFVYRINIPRGNFHSVPVKDFVIEPGGSYSLPESRPDDRVVYARIVRNPVRVTADQISEVYYK